MEDLVNWRPEVHPKGEKALSSHEVKVGVLQHQLPCRRPGNTDNVDLALPEAEVASLRLLEGVLPEGPALQCQSQECIPLEYGLPLPSNKTNRPKDGIRVANEGWTLRMHRRPVCLVG